MKRNFDNIASIYDALASIVFGNSIKQAQVEFLNSVGPYTNVLIIGGGTGWMLAKLLKCNETCIVDYYETSEQMVEMTTQRLTGHEKKRVTFLLKGEVEQNKIYDVVVTHFFLDLFTTEQLGKKIDQIDSVLTPDALWIAADFVNGGKLWQRSLLKIMYLFFRITSGVRTCRLPPWQDILSAKGWYQASSKSFYFNFIKSVCFSRNTKSLHSRTDT